MNDILNKLKADMKFYSDFVKQNDQKLAELMKDVPDNMRETFNQMRMDINKAMRDKNPAKIREIIDQIKNLKNA